MRKRLQRSIKMLALESATDLNKTRLLLSATWSQVGSFSSASFANKSSCLCASLTTGYLSLRDLSLVAIMSATATRANHLLSAGMMYQGAHFALVRLNTSSYMSCSGDIDAASYAGRFESTCGVDRIAPNVVGKLFTTNNTCNQIS